MVAAAVIGGAVIGAAGSAYAGSQAADATRSASQSATNAQYAALDQQKQLAAPYTALGQAAMPTYQALLGIGGKGGPSPAQIQQTLQSLPGYQFTKQQGLQSTTNAATAMGMGLSGNTLTALDQYSSGLADQNYQQYLQDYLAPIQIGQGAAAGQAANIQTGATNLGNIAIDQGNNQASIQANEIAGLTRATSGGINNYMTYQTLQGLNNPTGAGGSSGPANAAGNPSVYDTSVSLPQTYGGGDAALPSQAYGPYG